MKIDGKLIASEIKERLKKDVICLRQKGILPHLIVVLIGNDPASLVYVNQKQKVAEEIGVKFSIFNFPASPAGRQFSIAKEELVKLVNRLNADKSAHGIIIQRPVPIDIEKDELDQMVIPAKDVDGFHPQSPFYPPVALAVLKILSWVEKDCCNNPKPFYSWLKEKKILVIGRGETAGRPIAETLGKKGAAFTVANSQTTNLKDLCLNSDIIISCVGISNIVRLSSDSPHNGSPVVRHDMVKTSTILIGVGLHLENSRQTIIKMKSREKWLILRRFRAESARSTLPVF